MLLERMLHKSAATFGAALLAVALLAGCDSGTSVGKDDYVGKYKTKDTQGKEMTITLSEDGTATGERADETLTGKWKVKRDVAVINWQDDWVTRIAKKNDDKYRKSGYNKKVKAEGEKAQAADAEKIE